jgi:AmmeMemoRadiSam system protein A
LLRIARLSIEEGLSQHRPLDVDAARCAPALREVRATFVTLRIDEALRGCIGTVEASRPLACDTATQAYGAAFRDPRFPGLSLTEARRVDVHISILHPPEPIACGCEDELLAALRRGVDGIIVREEGEDARGGLMANFRAPVRGRRATFLPAVWNTLPEPRLFLEHLRAKAGLPPGYWSPTLRFWRYTTESVP